MLKFIDIIVPISGRFGCNMWYDDGPLPADLLQSSPPLSRKLLIKHKQTTRELARLLLLLSLF